MKSTLYKQWWFIAVCALIGIVSFRHVWMWLPEHQYTRMVQHDSFVAALQNDQPTELKRLAQGYGYDYQVFKDGKLQESSRSGLPYLRLIRQPLAAAGVLSPSLKEQLLQSKPYEFSHGLHRYIFFGTTAGRYTYVVYGKVL